MKKPRTILPTDHQITAANYVRDNFAELEAMRLNQVQMAIWLSHVLGLKILNSHIGKINARAGVKFTQGKEGNLAPIPRDEDEDASRFATIDILSLGLEVGNLRHELARTQASLDLVVTRVLAALKGKPTGLVADEPDLFQ